MVGRSICVALVSGVLVATSSGSFAGESAADAVAKAREPLTKWPGPSSSPALQHGKTIYVITCTSQAIGCLRAANGVREAGELAGWTVRVVDGKGDPATWNSAIQAAIAAKADGIVLDAVPPALVGDALDRAAKAHIVLVSIWNPIPESGSPVFAYVLPDHTAQGNLMAKWVEADSHGQGKVLIIEDREFPELNQRVEGFQKTLAECAGCKVVGKVDTTIATMAQRVPGLVAADLSRNPSIEYIVAPFDTNAFFVTEGVRQAGRTGAVKVASYEADPQAIDLIRSGVQAVSIADPAEWTGWQAVDELNRAFSGASAANTRIPFRLLDKDNAPSTKGWMGDVDFKGAYRKLWGLH